MCCCPFPAVVRHAQVIIGLLRSAMMSRVPGGSKDFLIDGFPRALDQAQMFEKMVKQPKMVLAFDCPEVC
jgi:adenylate kinase family enzyme